MATGFMQRFKGRMMAAELWLASGGKLVDAGSGIFGFPHFAQKLAIIPTAVAATNFTMSIPPGSTINGITVFTTVAFTGGSALLLVGSAAAGAQYVASVSIASVGIIKTTLIGTATGLAAMPTGSPNLFFDFSQTSAPTAVGAATVIVEYFTP
jgi:hypothetical protein